MITSTGTNAATAVENKIKEDAKDKTKLGKDDFLNLLLVELQHQDPTEPMDSDKILSQTSQLATLESAQKTNDTLAKLASSLGSSQQFSTISAIGKTADLGSNAISHDKGKTSNFEVYFPDNIAAGTLEILDGDGKKVATMPVEKNPSGVYKFEWDGKLNSGEMADSALYYVTASYNNSDGKALTTKLGSYPIESIKFDEGETLVKVGSSYVPLANIKEVY